MSTEPSDPAAEAPPGAGSSADPKARARMEAFRAVVALICGPPDAGEEAGPPLMRFSGQEAGFVTDEGGLHVLAVAGKGEPVVPWLEQLAARVGRGMVHRILVVQPEAELRATLEALSLRFPKGGSVALFVLDEDGQIWCSEDAELGPFLGRIGPDLLAQTVPPKAWAASLQAAKARGDDSRAEAERWRGPRPVSIGLLVVVVVVWLLEELWGGSGFPPTLWRMGAVLGDGQTWAEPWRLLASTLLHGGWWHVGMNGFMLFGLGGLLERMLGGPRMLLAFTLSGLSGALAAAAFGAHGSTVGSSGGLFGLFAVLIWVTWFPGEVMRFGGERQAKMKSSLLRDVLLLVFISLLPGVSLAGHAGGAAAGFLLAASGLITRSPNPDLRPRTWAVGAVCTVALLGSLVVSLGVGRPWELTDEDAFTEVTLGSVHLDLPSTIADKVSLSPGRKSAVFGTLVDDPLEVRLGIQPTWVASGDMGVALGEQLAAEWNTVPATGGFERSEPAVAYQEGDRVLVTEAFDRRDGVVLRQGALLTPEGGLRVVLVALPGRVEARPVFFEELLLETRWGDEAP